MKVLAISGSRNPAGQTARATDAFLQGVAEQNGAIEHIFLPTMNVNHCRQCDDAGWGICRTDGKCVINDDLDAIVQKIRASGAVVFATPVYFGDLSESMKSLLDRLRRTCVHENGRKGIEGKPAVVISVAGGGGGGAPNCCDHLTGILSICGFNVVDVNPVRRQNLRMKIETLRLAGKWLAGGMPE